MFCICIFVKGEIHFLIIAFEVHASPSQGFLHLLRDVLVEVVALRALHRLCHVFAAFLHNLLHEGRLSQNLFDEGSIVVGDVAQMVGQIERGAVSVALLDLLALQPGIDNLGVRDAVIF